MHRQRKDIFIRTRLLVLLLISFALIRLASATVKNNKADPEGFFRSLDKDADGDVDADELRRVIRESGVEQFDEQHEVEVGVQTALSLDKDNDRALPHKDLVSQWVTFASLMTPETVGDWMTHAIGLRSEIAEKFVHANWTGLDLPKLLNGNADTILSEAKVHLTRAEKIKLVGAIKLRMLNVGRVPHAPELRALESSKSARCGIVMLTWSSPARSFPEIHKYRIFRRIARDDDLPEHPWTLVFEGHTTSFTDRIRDISPQFDYKIEAWNLVGRSIPTELHDVVPSRRGCDSTSWLAVMFNFLADVRMYSVNLIGAFTFIFFLFKTATGSGQEDASLLRREKSFRPPSLSGNGHASFSASSVPTLMNNGGSFYQKTSSSSLVLDESAEQQPALPDMHAEGASPVRHLTSQQARREYSTDRCVECGKPVTRSTRHQCGMCLHVFCTKHTAIHPHLETKVPFMGTVVLSACGIDSKCRCFPCSGLPRSDSGILSDSSGEGGSKRSDPPATTTKEKKRLWRSVTRDVLLKKKTIKALQRSRIEEQPSFSPEQPTAEEEEPAAVEVDATPFRTGNG